MSARRRAGPAGLFAKAPPPPPPPLLLRCGAALALLAACALALHGFDDTDDDSGRGCDRLPGAVGCNAGRCPCDDGSGLPLYSCSTSTAKGRQADAAGEAIGECVQSPSFYALVSAPPVAAALLLVWCCFCCKRTKMAAKGAAAARAAAEDSSAGGGGLASFCTQCARPFQGGADERFCAGCGAQRARVVGDTVVAGDGDAGALPPPGYVAASSSSSLHEVSEWHGIAAVGRASAP